MILPFVILVLCSVGIPIGLSQAPSPAQDACNGIFLTYEYKEGARIHPFLSNSRLQPYSFRSTATILNTGDQPLKAWNLFIGFRHREILVSASPAVLTDGTQLPAQVGNGTFFSGFPNPDLKTAIETAGDQNEISVEIELVGTEFGVAPRSIPMPSNISLANDGYRCPAPTRQGRNLIQTCCIRDRNLRANVSEEDEEFLPRRSGDLTIMYDVLQSYDSNYLASVNISNHNPLGRLDNWRLSWEWMRGEFIFNMRGAYTSVKDFSDCIFGQQGVYYRDFDFTRVMNCEKSPTILDLPLSRANDTNVGRIPFCCRNGTLLPPYMDPSKSVSVFQIEVYKMPPDLNRTQLFPPQSWRISGLLNPDYQCGPPVRVSPTKFPDSSGLQSTTSAITSWQVVCNITQPKGSHPRCCVSFSAYYNDSVVPCRTCACGCPSSGGSSCSTRAPALLLPSESLLVPFANRTQKALAWAALKHFDVPKPLPCGDFCGVSINWHVATDYRRGWSARITLFNWEDYSFEDWFLAVQLDKAFKGYEETYSFNGSVLADVNNTVFIQGRPGLNYLIGETDSDDPSKDPRVPGKQQSVISFEKKSVPGIDVAKGDGFPSKVFFNGEECALPLSLPVSWGYSRRPISVLSVSVMMIIASLLMQLWTQ